MLKDCQKNKLPKDLPKWYLKLKDIEKENEKLNNQTSLQITAPTERKSKEQVEVDFIVMSSGFSNKLGEYKHVLKTKKQAGYNNQQAREFDKMNLKKEEMESIEKHEMHEVFDKKRSRVKPTRGMIV